LERENVVVAVDNEAREEVGFAEDYAAGVGVLDISFAIGDGFADALRDERGEIGDGVARGRFSGDHADGDLRGGTVEGGAVEFAALVEDGDGCAGFGVLRGDVGLVDPGVPGFQAGQASGGECDGGGSRRWFWRGRGGFRHEGIIKYHTLTHASSGEHLATA